jgi:carboxymethylenebutenolidase
VVIHHMPGYDSSTKEIARRFAAHGYGAVVPNLFHRYAPGADPSDAAAAARAAGGVPDSQCLEDVAGAAAFLRAVPGANGKVGVIGYCSGGRQTYLTACNLDVDAAVVCYGGGIVATPEQLTPERPRIWHHFLRARPALSLRRLHARHAPWRPRPLPHPPP